MTYLCNGFVVSETEGFVYEVWIAKYYKNRYEQIYSKLVRSPKLLKMKKSTISKKYSDYQLIKGITLIGVPESYIKDNKLKENIKNKKK